MARLMIFLALYFYYATSYSDNVKDEESICFHEISDENKIYLLNFILGKSNDSSFDFFLDENSARRVIFMSPLISPHGKKLEEFYELDGFKVKRFSEDFAGNIVERGVYSIPREEFFCRLGFLYNHIQKNHAFPYGAIEWRGVGY